VSSRSELAADVEPAGIGALVDRMAPWLFSVGSALLALALMGRGGPHLSPDSIQYLSVASNLLRGHGLTNYEGHPLLVWPPAYPVVLAALGAAAPDHLLGVAQIFGVVAAGATGLLAWMLARRHLPAGVASCVVLLCLLASAGPIVLDSYAWVESIFVPASLGLILCLERAGDRSQTRWWSVVGAGAIGALLGLTSYGGWQVVLVSLVALAVVPARDVATRLRRLLVFGLVAGLPNLAWIVRNVALSGDPAGPRVPPTFTVGSLAHQVVTVVQQLFLPGVPSRAGFWGALLLLVVVGALGVAVAVRTARERSSGEGDPGARVGILDPLAIVGIGSFVLLAASSLVVWVSMDARTLDRVIVPLVVLGAVWVRELGSGWWSARTDEVRRALTSVALLVVVVWAALLVVQLHRSAGAPRTDYSAASWAAKGPGLRAVVRTSTSVWSNQPDIVWRLTGHDTALSPQRKVHFDPHTPAEQLQRFGREVTAGGGATVLVWFHAAGSPGLEPSGDLLVPVSDLQRVARFSPAGSGAGWQAWRLRTR
jgi:hypothetical protein